MAVHGSTDDTTTKTAAPGPDPAPQMRAPGPDTMGNSGSLFGLMNTLGASQSLGGTIEEYLKTIKSYFGNDSSASLAKIEVRRLAEPNGAHAFIADKKAIVMLFTEMLPADLVNFVPKSDYTSYANRALTAQFGSDMGLINVVEVLPNDYSRAQQMAQYISVSLAIAVNPGLLQTNIAVLQDSTYSIDPDVVAARNYINGLNPSSVAPRVDVGFTIYAKQPRRSTVQLGPLEDSRPIAAVGGYTEILTVQDQTQAIKYLPMFHITAIASAIPLPGIVPLCITIAADQFISTGRWLQPYATFQKGKPNLGQLFPDPQDQKKLWFADSPVTLDQIRFAHFLPAVLAIDVAEGQARIPALAAYGHVKYQQVVYEQTQNFFGPRIQLDRTQPPYFIHASDYLGVYGDRNNNLLDSRNIDYVTLLADGSLDASAKVLLGYPQDLSIRARVISDKTGGTFQSLFRTTISVLSPSFLSTLAQFVQQTLSIDAPQGASRMSSTDWAKASSQLYQSSTFNVTRNAATGGYGVGNYYIF